MTVTLVLTDELLDQLVDVSRLEVETAGVLLARPATLPNGDVRLLGRRICWVLDDAYEVRTDRQLQIASHGYVPALADAEADGAVPIWFHTHPGDGSSPHPSEHDDRVDSLLAEVFRIRAGTELYGTLVIAHKEGHLTFTGRLETEHAVRAIDRLWQVGDRWRMTFNHDRGDEAPAAIFDRNLRAFGGDVQRTLGTLAITVVGAGGTGSAVAEQLVRLGVRRLRLLDPDHLSLSNVTRVYGSTPDDIGRPKVDVLSDHLRSIAPDLAVETCQGAVTEHDLALTVADSDVVFGCTDDNAGRLVLSRLSSYMLCPVIDCGVLLTSSPNGELLGIDGRVTIMSPGSACLVCRNRIDTKRAAAELMTSEEHERLAGEGYAPALAGVEPAVVTFTTHVAAAAVTELLERLTGFGPTPVPSELLLRLHDREISTNIQLPNARHYCHPDTGKLGLGLGEPLWEQTWTR